MVSLQEATFRQLLDEILSRPHPTIVVSGSHERELILTDNHIGFAKTDTVTIMESNVDNVEIVKQALEHSIRKLS